MDFPPWLGRRYPTLTHLEDAAWAYGAVVIRGPIDHACIAYSPDPADVTVICLPEGLGVLAECWQLAHELGHLVLHAGYSSPWAYDRQEAAAMRWAAQALIPESAVRRHKNASLDAFIGALSAHFEDIPLHDCPQRRLAAEIATIRLRAVEEVA